MAKAPTTDLSVFSGNMLSCLEQDFGSHEIVLDEYSKMCGMNAVSSIFNLVQSANNTNLGDIDMSNVRDIVGQAASLKLNANASPSEVYFQLRNKKVGNQFVKTIEMGIQGNGWLSILTHFGTNVKKVYPVWIVHEKDKFVYPKHRGIEITPPEWEEVPESGKAVRVVYPIMLDDGEVIYKIAERNGVKTNLLAHVKQNMMNATFGICDNAFKATQKQRDEIAEKKHEVLHALNMCATVDDMLACELAQPFMSPAWKDSSEAMIIRKMCNNAIRNYPKDYSSFAKASLVKQDEVFAQAQQEIRQEENSVEFNVAADVEIEEENIDE